jgi:hypothetical protein
MQIKSLFLLAQIQLERLIPSPDSTPKKFQHPTHIPLPLQLKKPTHTPNVLAGKNEIQNVTGVGAT